MSDWKRWRTMTPGGEPKPRGFASRISQKTTSRICWRWPFPTAAKTATMRFWLTSSAMRDSSSIASLRATRSTPFRDCWRKDFSKEKRSSPPRYPTLLIRTETPKNRKSIELSTMPTKDSCKILGNPRQNQGSTLSKQRATIPFSAGMMSPKKLRCSAKNWRSCQQFAEKIPLHPLKIIDRGKTQKMMTS